MSNNRLKTKQIGDGPASATTFLNGEGSFTTPAGTGANTALSNLASVAINTTLVSDTDNTDALGTSAIAWSDLFLGSGGVITFNSAPSTPDITLTHSADLLTLAGGDLSLGSNLLIGSTFKASSSAGILLESDNGTDILLLGAGSGSNATFYGGVNITGNLTVDTNVLYVDTTNDRLGILTSAPSHSITLGSTSNGLVEYNTADEVTNYTRGRLLWNSNVFEIGVDYAGTGTQRAVRIGTGTTAGGAISSGRVITLTPGSAPFISLSIGTTTIAGNVLTATGTFTGSSTAQVGFSVVPTVNQTSTAGFTGLLVQPTYTAVGSTGAIGIHSLGINEQLRLGYDASNYASFTTGSTGNVTIDNTGGAVTISKALVAPTSIQTSTTNTSADIFIGATSLASNSTTTAQYLLGGASQVSFRIGMRGSTNPVITAGNTYASQLIGQQAATIAASGTHTLFSQLGIRPLSITAGAGTLTNSATLYIEDAATGATNNYALWVDAGSSRFDGRILGNAATIASANDITLGNANSFQVTGTSTINTISGTGWTAGTVINLGFSSTATLAHNVAGTGASLLLAGAANFSATANDTMQLVYNGTNWIELSRTVI